ncbi:hypothetical protein KDA00_06020 [Candidatus Saccharibacteria bacterium]|nr:hypothetical protein [Candidatus Saccharibacteria bacterium]
MASANRLGEFLGPEGPISAPKVVYSTQEVNGFVLRQADVRVAPDCIPFSLTSVMTGKEYDFADVLETIFPSDPTQE